MSVHGDRFRQLFVEKMQLEDRADQIENEMDQLFGLMDGDEQDEMTEWENQQYEDLPPHHPIIYHGGAIK